VEARPKKRLVNLVLATMIFIAAFVVTGYVNSLAGQAASFSSPRRARGLRQLVPDAARGTSGWKSSNWNELVKSKGGSTLFGSEDTEVFSGPAFAGAVREIFRSGFGVLRSCSKPAARGSSGARYPGRRQSLR